MNNFYIWSTIFLSSLSSLIINLHILNQLFTFQFSSYDPKSFCQKLNKFRYFIICIHFLISIICIPIVPQSLILFISNIGIILYFRFFVFNLSQRLFDPLIIRRDLTKYKYRHLAIFFITLLTATWAIVEIIILAYAKNSY